MRTTTVVVGAGHAGLAMSHYLTQRSIDHVVIERGQVANTWRTERWDSLRLLTPNWQSRLPDFAYAGTDPDAYMSMSEVIEFIDAYARHVDAPLQLDTTVLAVRNKDEGYEVLTDNGSFDAATVVLASGGFNGAHIPPLAAQVPGSIEMIDPIRYRRPDQLASGGVLVVGASATGIQIADELQRSGRHVTLAVGEHVRLPRVYRGKDIMWWLEKSGIQDERYDQVDDLIRARHLPSPQLVGTPQRATLDLNALTDRGVKLVGKLAGIADGKAQFSGSLRNKCNLADLKLARLLNTLDEWSDQVGLDGEVAPPQRYAPTRVETSPPLLLDLKRGDIKTILWATGYRPDYSWLHLPVLDRKGQIRHDGGVVADAPGLYVTGLNMLRRRKSSFIHGADDDARELTDHLVNYLDQKPSRRPELARTQP